ncbi:MAG: FHA domain-containing protein, partial [Lachnospiraceae bacterium]
HNDKNAVEFIYGIYGLITDNGFIIPDIKAYIKGFKPGIVNSKAHYNKKQEDTHVVDGIITNTGINSKKENISRRFILSVEKASLPFNIKDKGYINICLGDAGKRIDESHLEASVGRSSSCNLVLPVCFVSRHHAMFYIEDEDIYIEDLSSINGTFVNGEKIPANVKILCNVNDIISFAGIKCRLLCG